MSKIEMSPAFTTDYVKRIAGKNKCIDVIPSPKPCYYSLLETTNPLLTNDKNASSFLHIMKGVIPTDFTTLVDSSSRETDILVTFSAELNDFSPTIDTTNPVNYSTKYVKALATNTATWFWWYVKNASTTELYHQMIGTINTVGSGADLEIPSVDIVTGVNHRIINMRLQLPFTWTY